MPTPEEILANRPRPESNYAEIKQFDGQEIEIIDVAFTKGRYENVILSVLAGGDVIEVRTSSQGVMGTIQYLLDNGAELPLTLKVISGPSSFPGKPWYDLESPEPTSV